MKIAMVFDGLQVGGIERVGIDYVTLLKKLGHDVSVINLNPNNKEFESELAGKVAITHYYLPRKLCGEQYAQLIKKNFIGKFIYPLVYIFLGLYLWIAKLVFRIGNHQRFDIVIAFSGHFNDLTFVANNFLITKKKMAWLHGALYGYLLISDGYYNLYNKIGNLVCLVDDAQDEALIYNHNTRLRINKLYNPTYISDKKIDEGKVEALKAHYGKFLLMVARFEYPHKDHYTVCKALEILRNDYSDDVQLVLVGSGPEEKFVKEYVKSNHLENYIHFVGTKFNVQDYYKAAKLLVHASVAGEGLPTVQLEAMVYGLPQVVTDSKVGPREILGNDEYGLLSKVKDPNDMAKQIHRLLTDDDLYQFYVRASKQRIKDFQPDTIQTKLEKILLEVMER